MASFKFSKGVRVQLFIAACFNLCEFINGYEIAWPGPLLPKFDDPSQSPLSYTITDLQKTYIASALFFGYFGSFSGGYLANLIGRKMGIVLGGALYLATNILVTCATEVSMIYVGRFMVGTSICYLMVLEIMYIGEIASPGIRGIIMTSMGVSHAAGSLLVYCVGPFVKYASVGYIVICLNIVFMTACWFLPESPVFFVLKDDEDSARNALQQLGRDNDVETELKAMIAKVKEQRSNKHIWKELIESKFNRKSLLITVTLSFFQQSSGILVVIIYANTIFRYAGSSVHPDIASIIVGAVFVVGAVASPIFIDRHGRRILLLLSSAGLCIAMVTLGTYFYLRNVSPSSVENLGWLPLMILVIGELAYSFGMAIVPNILIGELFTSKARGLGSSISLSSGSISALVSTTLYGYIVVVAGIQATFWMFALSNAVVFLFVLFFVSETMGKSLIEIQEMLEK